MRISEAIKILRSEFPQYTNSRINLCLKIEMQGGVDAAEALDGARAELSGRRYESRLPKHLRDPR